MLKFEWIESVLKIIDKISQSSIIEEEFKASIESEFQRFQKTVKQGQHIMERVLRQNQGHTLSGSQIVFLEKRHGLPVVLIADLLQQGGLQHFKFKYEKALRDWKQKHKK